MSRPEAHRSALRYLAAGLAPVPLFPGTKRPLTRWAEYCHRRPTLGEIAQWWAKHPAAGVALVCGRVSSLAVLDEDPRHGGDASLERYSLPSGPLVLTGGGGRHFYFALNGEVIPKISALLPGVDLLGEGALATAPGSVHPNGRPYHWAPGRALGEVPLPQLPTWLRRLVAERRTATARPVRGSWSGEAPPAIEAVLVRLRRVRRTRTGWSACCPAHEDRTPSLSIGVSSNGRVLLHCFTGCSFAAVCAALEAAV